PIVNALGQVVDAAVAGRAMFERDGQRHSLVATAAGTPGKLFFNFRDATNLHETYGGGRFLNVDGPVDGRIVPDLNPSHHPPGAARGEPAAIRGARRRALPGRRRHAGPRSGTNVRRPPAGGRLSTSRS